MAEPEEDRVAAAQRLYMVIESPILAKPVVGRQATGNEAQSKSTQITSMDQRLNIAFPVGPLQEAFKRLHTVHVETARHREVQDALKRLFMASGTCGLQKGLSIAGPSGSGKTTAVAACERWLRKALGLAPDAPSPLPVALLTSNTTPKGLASNVMHAAGDPLATRGSQTDIERRMKELGRSLPAVGIAIDEFHHAFARKSPAESERMAMTLKTMVNSLEMPIIVMGVDGIENYTDGSKELSQRFRRKVFLEDPRVTSREDMEDMRRVMQAMKAVLPCDSACDLDTPQMLVRLLLAAQCRFGGVVDLVRRACEFGAAEQAERVTIAHFRHAYRESAARESRSEAHDPFVMPLETVKALALQVQSSADRASRPRSE